MKFIKEYINFNEFEYEENNDLDKPFNIGNKIKIIDNIYYWNSLKNKWEITNILKNKILIIKDIKLSKDIDNDGIYNIRKGSIPFDGWLFMINQCWPWVKYEEEKIKKLI